MVFYVRLSRRRFFFFSVGTIAPEIDRTQTALCTKRYVDIFRSVFALRFPKVLEITRIFPEPLGKGFKFETTIDFYRFRASCKKMLATTAFGWITVLEGAIV